MRAPRAIGFALILGLAPMVMPALAEEVEVLDRRSPPLHTVPCSGKIHLYRVADGSITRYFDLRRVLSAHEAQRRAIKSVRPGGTCWTGMVRIMPVDTATLEGNVAVYSTPEKPDLATFPVEVMDQDGHVMPALYHALVFPLHDLVRRAE